MGYSSFSYTPYSSSLIPTSAGVFSQTSLNSTRRRYKSHKRKLWEDFNQGINKRLKQDFSFTKTITEPEESEQMTDYEKSLSESSMYLKVGRPLRGVTNARICGNASYQGIIGNIAGLPGWDVIGAIGTVDQVLEENGAAYTNYVKKWPCSYFYMNPYVIPNGIAKFAPYVDGETPQMDRIGLSYVSHDFFFTNAQSSGSVVTLYAFIAKRDLNYDPLDLAGQLDSRYALGANFARGPDAGSLTTNFRAGYEGVDNIDAFNVPGSTPFNLPAFKQNYKLLGTKHFTLAAGASKRIHVTTQYNQMFAKEACQQANDSGNHQSLKGKTVWFVCKIEGVPVRDDTTAESYFTYSSSTIGYCCNVKKYFKLCKDSTSKLNLNLAWSRIPVGASLAHQKEVDINDQVHEIVKTTN